MDEGLIKWLLQQVPVVVVMGVVIYVQYKQIVQLFKSLEEKNEKMVLRENKMASVLTGIEKALEKIAETHITKQDLELMEVSLSNSIKDTSK